MSRILDHCQNLQVWSYEAGDTILHEGRKDGHLYILKRGAVEVRKRNVTVNTSATPGAIFGEISVLLQGAHSAAVVAVEPSEFFVAEDGVEFLQAHPELNHHIAKLMALRLQRVTEQLTEVQELVESGAATPDGHFQGVLRTLADQF